MSTPQELYNAVIWQNDIMRNRYTQMRDSYSTDQRRVGFVVSKIGTFTYVNFILWILYYLLVFLFVIYYMFKGSFTMAYSTRFKVFLLCLFLLFPMIILTLELWVAYIVTRLGTLIFGIPFPREWWTKVPHFSFLYFLPPGVT
jgi:hypothetical protein